MRFGKRILRHSAVRRFLCWLAAWYIRLVRVTTRWTVRGRAAPERLWAAGRPFILCFWHGRLLMMPCCWNPKAPIHMLISEHPDGRLIADTTAHFGIQTVVGSTSRGGASALRAMVRLLRGGESVGITPDGPRGPRMRASVGVASLARLAGVPVLACAYGISRRRVLGSWDRFVVALPFARGAIVWGEPIEIARDADTAALDAARLRIEDELNRVTAEADRLVEVPPIAPAAVASGAGGDR